MATATVRADPGTPIREGAIGYDRAPQGWVEYEDHRANGLLGAGGVYASLEDLFRWDQAPADTVLVGRQALEEAFSPPSLGSGAPGPYGFGWMVTDLIGEPAIHHTGSWVGFREGSREAREALTGYPASPAKLPATPTSGTITAVRGGTSRQLAHGGSDPIAFGRPMAGAPGGDARFPAMRPRPRIQMECSAECGSVRALRLRVLWNYVRSPAFYSCCC